MGVPLTDPLRTISVPRLVRQLGGIERVSLEPARLVHCPRSGPTRDAHQNLGPKVMSEKYSTRFKIGVGPDHLGFNGTACCRTQPDKPGTRRG
ncbi:hypothetical protein EDF53_3264 [Curtobacterium sp. PhB78]|nr:hypothetical protein EDF53_3264 [Curtobacterium sp. PhB78]